MPKRISKPKRRGPSERAKAWANHFSNPQSSAKETPIGRWPPEQREAYVRQWAEGNLTTGPERTPLKPWTPEEVEAYKKMRLDEVRREVGMGLEDSTAGKYTEFESAEALTEHLKSLAIKAQDLP